MMLYDALQDSPSSCDGKGLGTCYSAAYMSRLKQQRFTRILVSGS